MAIHHRRSVADDNGRLLEGAPRHPIVEDDVVIYAGATSSVASA